MVEGRGKTVARDFGFWEDGSGRERRRISTTSCRCSSARIPWRRRHHRSDKKRITIIVIVKKTITVTSSSSNSTIIIIINNSLPIATTVNGFSRRYPTGSATTSNFQTIAKTDLAETETDGTRPIYRLLRRRSCLTINLHLRGGKNCKASRNSYAKTTGTTWKTR